MRPAAVVGILALALDTDIVARRTTAPAIDVDTVLRLTDAAIVLRVGVAQRVLEEKPDLALEGLPIFRSWNVCGGIVSHKRPVEASNHGQYRAMSANNAREYGKSLLRAV